MTHSLHSPEMTALLQWLRNQRQERGLSMRDLALRLDKPHSYVQKVETGERRLDVVEFVWYCLALGVAPRQGLSTVEKALEPPLKWPGKKSGA